MFNRKLKKRIELLEQELGYHYSDEYHSNSEDGDLPDIKRKINALLEYLGIKNIGTNYPNVKFGEVEKEE